VAVTLNQTVYVGWQASATAYFYRITQDAGGYYESGEYTDFPVATLSEFAGEATCYRVRVYVA
jgi:hypothetical protein